MDVRKGAGALCLLSGLGILGAWAVLLATQNVPELRAERTQFLFLLTAELVTVELLVVAAAGLLKAQPWAERAYLLATGMLAYGILHNTGVLLQAGAYRGAALEAALGIVSVALLAAAMKSRPRDRAPPAEGGGWNPTTALQAPNGKPTGK